MDRTRIVLVSPCFPPSAVAESICVLKKVRAWSRYGGITVLARGADGHGIGLPDDEELLEFVPPTVRVLRVAKTWRGRLRGRADAFVRSRVPLGSVLSPGDLQWAVAALACAARLKWFRENRLLVSDSSPVVSHLVGWVIRSRNPGLRWVQHYSDPFPDETYRRVPKIARRIEARLALRLSRRADRITVPSGEARTALLETLKSWADPDLASKVLVVPHVYDTEMMETAASRYAVKHEGGRADVRVLTYVGHFYGSRSLGPLYGYADHVRRRRARGLGPAVKIVIVGQVRDSDRRRIKDDYPELIELRPPVSYLESLAVMRASDALLVVDAETTGESPFFPSKLADYLGTARPVVGFTPSRGATARILKATANLALPVAPSAEQYARVDQFVGESTQRLVPPVSRPTADFENDERQYRAVLELLEMQ